MDHFQYHQSILHAEEVPIPELADKVGTPFYCYSTATLLRHYQVFQEALAPLDPLICYAVKANSARGVLTTLARAGSGADVVSGGEVRQALAAGIAPEKIVFSGVGKTEDEMRYALTQRIMQFNVESENELLLLSRVANEMGQRASIALRINPDVIPHTHAKISTGQKESKFGIPLAEARQLYATAAKLPAIHVQGVSVHIGSQLSSIEPFRHAFERVSEFVQELREAGHSITTLDLGGGLGIPYGNLPAPPSPQAYGDMVKKTVGHLGCKLILEPGRLIVGNAGILVTRVLYVKRSEGKQFVIVDAGMNDLIRPTLYSAFHEVVPVNEDVTRPQMLADIVGPVCETGDIFAADRSLPTVQEGELIAFRSAGAYGAVMTSTYNARPLLAEVMVHGKQHGIIRPRQTYEALLARDLLPAWLS